MTIESKGVYMAGGWWYCDCHVEGDTEMQKLDDRHSPKKEGETNHCSRCGAVWIAKVFGEARNLTGKKIVSLCWWRPDRVEA